ncbi:MAG TPA: hypothetical protein VHE55_04275 [Fimbriimonadaceae bacterium]|nr:hypothetical protein [Fimbriimonadaceae bacterium]
MAVNWICDRCGEIAEGDICTHCGRQWPPMLLENSKPGSYLWTYGYRNPAVYKVLGWPFLSIIFICGAGLLLQNVYLLATGVVSALVGLFVPIGLFAAKLARRAVLPLLVCVSIVLLLHRALKPDLWWGVMTAASIAVLLGIFGFCVLITSGAGRGGLRRRR